MENIKDMGNSCWEEILGNLGWEGIREKSIVGDTGEIHSWRYGEIHSCIYEEIHS